jgi:aspartate oxidase
MIEGAGVVRSADSLDCAGRAVEGIATTIGRGTPGDRTHGELVNLVTAAGSVLRSAVVRCETRGAHARSDYPDASDRWRRRIVHTAAGVALLRRTPTPDGHEQAAAGPAGR